MQRGRSDLVLSSPGQMGVQDHHKWISTVSEGRGQPYYRGDILNAMTKRICTNHTTTYVYQAFKISNKVLSCSNVVPLTLTESPFIVRSKTGFS